MSTARVGLRSHAGPFGRWIAVAVVGLLAGCGGGGDSGTTGPTTGTGSGSWTPGVFQPADTFVAQCASPRSGTDPRHRWTLPRRPGIDAHREQLAAVLEQRPLPLVRRHRRPRPRPALDPAVFRPAQDDCNHGLGHAPGPVPLHHSRRRSGRSSPSRASRSATAPSGRPSPPARPDVSWWPTPSPARRRRPRPRACSAAPRCSPWTAQTWSTPTTPRASTS